MPNKVVHVTVGTGLAGAIALARSADRQPEAGRILEVFGACLGGYVGARVPDLIDSPKLGPRHRGRAHSVLAGTTMIKVCGDELVRLEGRLRSWASELELKKVTAPPGSALEFIYGLAAVACRVLAGFVRGFPVGYISHLVLDAHTPSFLPVV